MSCPRLSRPFLLVAAILACYYGRCAETIVSTAELNRFIERQHEGSMTFSLTGTVTSCAAPSPDARQISFIIRDDMGLGEICYCKSTNVFPGAIVSVSGRVHVTRSLEYWMKDVSVNIVGQAPVPDPKTARLSEIQESRLNYETVTVTATVTDVFMDDLDPRYDFLVLKDGASIAVACHRHSPRNMQLIDSHVQITGVVHSWIASERKFAGCTLVVNDNNDIRICKPAPEDPFDYPPLEQILYKSPEDIANLGKRTARGDIVALWMPNNCLLKTDDNRFIRLSLANGESLPAYGDRVTAVGYPTTDLLRINFSKARWRKNTPTAVVEDEPEALDGKQLRANNAGMHALNGKLYGRLVSLYGIVRKLPALESGDRCLTLDVSGTVVKIDCSANPTAVRGVDIGNRIKVTGRCILEVGQWQPDDVFPRIAGIMIVVRTPADVCIISGSPWLTTKHFLVIILFLLSILVIAYLRARVMKRIAAVKLKERTDLAVELHDSLSQALTGLSCQITAAERDSNIESSKAKLTTATRMLQSCRTELRNCLFDLRNNLTAEKSIAKALQTVLEQFNDQAEILIRFNVPRQLFSDALVHAVVATIRELTANAIRHGHAWTIRIAGTVDRGVLHFSVSDDGCGFDPDDRPDSNDGHFGLDGIGERLERLNGTFSIASSTRGGTKAIVHIPLKKQ